MQVPDPGLLAKLEYYVTDQATGGAILDMKIVCKDGTFYWSSLLFAGLSPLMTSLLKSDEDECVLILPDACMETSRTLLLKLLRRNRCFLSQCEKELLLQWGVDRTFWRMKGDQKNFVQIVGAPTTTGYVNFREIIDSCENDVDIIWKDEPSPDNHLPDNSEAVDNPASLNLEESDLKVNIKVKKSGSGRKMFCKLCSLSFQSRPYADYQDHINSHKNAQGLYACNQPGCGRLFRAWCHLSDHVYSHGNLPKPHLCSYCNYTSTTRANIKKHEIAVHEDPDRRDFSCDKCTKKFKTSSNLYEHMRVHNPDYRHSCPICKKEFKSMVGYNQHLRLHSGDLFSCGVCGEKFQSKHSVNRHEKDIHGMYSLPEGSKTYKCGKKTCAAEFDCEEDYRLHLKSAHQNKAGLLICHLCKKICSNRMTLKLHFKKMHQNEVDPVTGKPGKKKSLLKIENNEKDKPKRDGISSTLTCECCDKKFKFKYQLYSHIAQKQGTGLYCVVAECTTAGQVFPSVEALELHLQEHTGEVSHPCMLCFKHFSTASARDKHTATHEEGKGGYDCPHCDVTQPSRMVLNMHVKYCKKKANVDEEMIQLDQEDLITLGSSVDTSVSYNTNKYACQSCGVVMDSLEQVPIHKCNKNYSCTPHTIKLSTDGDAENPQQMFYSQEEVRCLLCKDVIVKTALDSHMKVKHMEKLSFKCVACQKCFSTNQSLQRHTLSQHSREEEICSLCNAPIGDNLSSHEKNCPVRSLTSCKICDLVFENENSLNSHITSMHKLLPTEESGDLVMVVNTNKFEQPTDEVGGVTVYQVGEETVEMEEQEMVITLQKDDMIVYQMEGV